MIFIRIIVDTSFNPPRVYTGGRLEATDIEDALEQTGAFKRRLVFKLPVQVVGATYIGVDKLRRHQFLQEDDVDISSTDFDLRHLAGELADS